MPPQISAAMPQSSVRGQGRSRGRPPSRASLGGRGGGISGGQGAFKPPRPTIPPQKKIAKRTHAQSSLVEDDEEGDEMLEEDEVEEEEEEEVVETSRAKTRRRSMPEETTRVNGRPSMRGEHLPSAVRKDGNSLDDFNLDDIDNLDDDLDNDTKTTKPAIPPELLTRLLHHVFQKPNTRITQDANSTVNKYMEIFVSEAVARSVAERPQGGFMDVDVLQKVAAQLIMDM